MLIIIPLFYTYFIEIHPYVSIFPWVLQSLWWLISQIQFNNQEYSIFTSWNKQMCSYSSVKPTRKRMISIWLLIDFIISQDALASMWVNWSWKRVKLLFIQYKYWLASEVASSKWNGNLNLSKINFGLWSWLESVLDTPFGLQRQSGHFGCIFEGRECLSILIWGF